MIKLVSITNTEIGTLLYDRHIPRVGEVIVSDDRSYEVIEVIYNDDNNDILIRVEGILNTRYGNPKFAGMPPSADRLEEVRRLALSGEKLRAVKLYKEIMGIGLREAKDYIDSLS